MVKTRECACCNSPAAENSTLCVDCLEACRVRVLNKKTELETRLEIDRCNAAVIISEKNAEIEDLMFRLKLRTILYQAIFKEYQELLMAVKEEICKKQGG